MGNPTAIGRRVLALIAALCLIASCVTPGPNRGLVHRWWSGFGPVLPHDTFPADCNLCHFGSRWHELREDFSFDHEARTGVRLDGAHAGARCLRCHNDRGPVAVFKSRGCAGCHEDTHLGELGSNCKKCHDETSWRPYGQIEFHVHTRLPLTGAHAPVACHRCHPGARAGNFAPVDSECVGCHTDDLNRTNNPPHIPLGWTDQCDRCHMATRWRHATIR